MSEKKAQVKCPQCGKLGPINVVEIPTGNVTDVGVECVHCGHFVHSYYLTPALKRAGQILEQAKARKSPMVRELTRIYQKMFDQVQQS